MDNHAARTLAQSSLLFRGKVFGNLLTISDQTCSIGLRSGEFPGQGNTRTGRWRKNSRVVFAVWAGAESCWKIQPGPFPTQKSPSSWTSLRIWVWYWTAFRFPSTSFRGARAWCPMAPQTWICGPLFGIPERQYGLYFSEGVRVTNTPCRLFVTRKIFSSVKTMRVHWTTGQRKWRRAHSNLFFLWFNVKNGRRAAIRRRRLNVLRQRITVSFEMRLFNRTEVSAASVRSDSERSAMAIRRTTRASLEPTFFGRPERARSPTLLVSLYRFHVRLMVLMAGEKLKFFENKK